MCVSPIGLKNIDGWERFSLSFPFLIELCEASVYRNSGLELFSDNWPADNKKNALSHMKCLESFEFVYALITLQQSLLYMKEAVVALQAPRQELVSGVALIEWCCTELKQLRKNVDDYSLCIFQHSTRICEHSGIAVTMPCLCHHQRNQSNPVGSSIEDFFKQTVAIPFLNHLNSDVSFRFDEHTKQAASLQRIIPSLITTNLSHNDISEGVDFYSDDLPNTATVDEEPSRWKSRWLAVPEKDRPQSLSAALKQCSPDQISSHY